MGQVIDMGEWAISRMSQQERYAYSLGRDVFVIAEPYMETVAACDDYWFGEVEKAINAFEELHGDEFWTAIKVVEFQGEHDVLFHLEKDVLDHFGLSCPFPEREVTGTLGGVYDRFACRVAHPAYIQMLQDHLE